MKLRNFLYINSKLLDDYISAIDGYVYEEETQKLNEINQKAANAKANVLGIGGDGKYEKQSSEEVERKVRISEAAKFDKLFEYSLVTGKMEETYHMEQMEVGTILSAILDGQVSDLVNDGWEVEENLSSYTTEGCVMADVEFFQRVLDNLLSNIRKYADKSGKVILGVKEGEGSFTFSIRNRVLHEEALGGSTGVGLKTCQKIMEAMDGDFRVERTDNVYCVSATLPLVCPRRGRAAGPAG